MLESIEEIQQFVASMTFDQFQADRKTMKAVMADFAIMGEAAGHLPESLTEQHPTVPWSIMRAMRNRLVHVYFSVSPLILWDTIQQDLPALVGPLRQVLVDLDDDGG
ncbi:MAG: DUF86 domain-containing protein [Chloroflexi bacterium]|nr:MAG: DUF86 domain-containing protein [Chloroflexota bacterium]